MKARIPKHREFVINLEKTAEERRDECWEKLEAILEDYKKEGKSVYTQASSRTMRTKSKHCRQSTALSIQSNSNRNDNSRKGGNNQPVFLLFFCF